MPDRILARIHHLRSRVLECLANADAKAAEDKCDKYPYKAGMFGAQLEIVAAELYLIEREAAVELEDVA